MDQWWTNDGPVAGQMMDHIAQIMGQIMDHMMDQVKDQIMDQYSFAIAA